MGRKYTKTIADMRKLAAIRSGECLSDEYKGNRTKLLWKCAHGHLWSTVPYAVRLGRWCPECAKANASVKSNSKKYTMKQIQDLATERGGQCLSDNYENKDQKLEWKCKYGHIWQTSFHNIHNGNWCPVCAIERKKENYGFDLMWDPKTAK